MQQQLEHPDHLIVLARHDAGYVRAAERV